MHGFRKCKKKILFWGNKFLKFSGSEFGFIKRNADGAGARISHWVMKPDSSCGECTLEEL